MYSSARVTPQEQMCWSGVKNLILHNSCQIDFTVWNITCRTHSTFYLTDSECSLYPVKSVALNSKENQTIIFIHEYKS